MNNEETMTNGFARIVLVQLNTDEQLNVREHEAIRVAIKALEQQTCEDAISREDALIALTGEWTDSTDELIHRFIKRIKSLPSVNPQYTEDEIQKMQDLEQAEIEKAYEFGKTEGQKTDVLDKIRAEIECLTITEGGDDYTRKMAELYSLKIKVLQIINKYKAESEDV